MHVMASMAMLPLQTDHFHLHQHRHSAGWAPTGSTEPPRGRRRRRNAVDTRPGPSPACTDAQPPQNFCFLFRAPRPQIADASKTDDPAPPLGHEACVAAAPQRPASWLAYAQAEAARGDVAACRGVLSRALATLEAPAARAEVFLFHAELEALCGQPEQARAMYAAACEVNPADSDMWLRWLEFEGTHGTPQTERDAFGRWVDYAPAPAHWQTMVAREEHRGDVAAALMLCERLVAVHSTPETWLFYAGVAARHCHPRVTAAVFERAVLELQYQHADDTPLMPLLSAYAAFVRHAAC